MKRYAIFLFALLAFASGCKSDSENKSSTTTNAATEIQDPVEYLGRGEPRYNLYPIDATDEFADASIDSWSYKNGRFDFQIGGNSYQLQSQSNDRAGLMCANSDQGQHLHVILNSQPYSAQYEASFDFNIPNGQHHLLAFLGKSYHESLKTPEARVARLIEVENGNITNEWNIPTPSLFYSRPKGTYVGDETKQVLIDFYPVNINVGEDAKIKLQINGEQYYLYAWKSYIVEGLPYGDNTIGIQLVDLNGEPVNGEITSHFRKFQLMRDPAEEIN